MPLRLPGGPDKKIRIPVQLGDARLGSLTDFASRPPIVMIQIASDEDWNENCGRFPVAKSDTLYRALVDTGSEGTAVDESIAEQLGIVANLPVDVSGYGGVAHERGARVQLVFPRVGIVFAGGAVITQLHSAGHSFDAILGRDFLAHCRFEVDGHNNSYCLWWIG